MSGSLRVLLAGMVASDVGQGGATWAVLQYALGLRHLGHEVLVVEPADHPAAEARAYFAQVMDRFGLDGEMTMTRAEYRDFDLALNLSGSLPAGVISEIPARVYMDLDPAFNQLWQAQGIDRGFAGHTHFVTVGQAIGKAGCDVPTHGLDWIGTLPPVVLECWAPGAEIRTDAMTTVANFRGYGSIDGDGVSYGQKVHSLRALIDIPARARQRCVLAMRMHPDEARDISALAGGGWELVDPAAAAGTPDLYQGFVQGSRAEIGIAKTGYVVSRCGWFSDRSACYLASGRPVVAQDTGFSNFVPTGDGLLAFQDADGAVAAIEELRRDYRRHARRARELAVEYLDSDRVLTALLDRVAA